MFCFPALGVDRSTTNDTSKSEVLKRLLIPIAALVAGTGYFVGWPKIETTSAPGKPEAIVTPNALVPEVADHPPVPIKDSAPVAAQRIEVTDSEADSREEVRSLSSPAQQQAVSNPGTGNGQPHIVAIAGPPADFDPQTASAGELNKYGVPPRPDPAKDPKGFAIWQKVMANVKERLTPEIQETNVIHGPIQFAGPVAHKSSGISGAIDVASFNWTGPIIDDPSNPFALSSIYGVWVVPVAKHAFGHPNRSLDMSGAWVGIDGVNDGFISPDVFQAGTESDASFVNGADTPNYYFWIEWYPKFEQAVKFPVKGGDIVFVEIWNDSGTTGFAYLANFSTNRAAAYRLVAPPGIQLRGNCAEWIVERPGLVINGRVTQPWLTNYIGNAFTFCQANGRDGVYQPGIDNNSPTSTVYNASVVISLADPRIISQSFLAGPQSIWFWDESLARSR